MYLELTSHLPISPLADTCRYKAEQRRNGTYDYANFQKTIHALKTKKSHIPIFGVFLTYKKLCHVHLVYNTGYSTPFENVNFLPTFATALKNKQRNKDPVKDDRHGLSVVFYRGCIHISIWNQYAYSFHKLLVTWLCVYQVNQTLSDFNNTDIFKVRVFLSTHLSTFITWRVVKTDFWVQPTHILMNMKSSYPTNELLVYTNLCQLDCDESS